MALRSATLEETVEKARFLMDALPFIQKFRGSTVVVKYGGRVMSDERLKESVARDVLMMESVGLRPVIVHGGGAEITALMKRLGQETRFEGGLRVTDSDTLEVTEMVLAGKVNGEIVMRLNRAGGRAVGLSGKDGSLIQAKKLAAGAGPDLGFVGDVDRINVDVLHHLTGGGFIPVIAPIGVDAEGQTYNINADFVAAEVAAALGARKLVLLTDQRGVLRDPSDEASLIDTIAVEQIEGLLAEGVIDGGMIPKVRAAVRALLGGVKKTHILDGRIPHSLLLELFTSEGVGTQIQ